MPNRGEIQNRTVYGVPYSRVIYDEAVEYILKEAKARHKAMVFTPNVQHFYLHHKNKQFRRAYSNAQLLLIDGIPLVWVANCLSREKISRIAGSDIFIDLIKTAAQQRIRTMIFGSMPGVSEIALKRLGLEKQLDKTIFTYSPPFGFHQNGNLREEARKEVNRIRPDLLFVALGAPKAEIWLLEEISQLNIGAAVSIGASVDFAAGHRKRAPLWVQKCGFEWLYRLAFEPRRLFFRYLVTNTYFLPYMVRACGRRLLGKMLGHRTKE